MRELLWRLLGPSMREVYAAGVREGAIYILSRSGEKLTGDTLTLVNHHAQQMFEEVYESQRRE